MPHHAPRPKPWQPKRRGGGIDTASAIANIETWQSRRPDDALNNGLRDCHVSIFAISDAVSIPPRHLFGRHGSGLGAWCGKKTIALLMYGTIDVRYFTSARIFNTYSFFVLRRRLDFGRQAGGQD